MCVYTSVCIGIYNCVYNHQYYDICIYIYIYTHKYVIYAHIFMCAHIYKEIHNQSGRKFTLLNQNTVNQS